MFDRVRILEFIIVFIVIAIGGVLANILGYTLRLDTAWRAVLVLLLAPVLEEYVFRFHLQQWIAKRFQAPVLALILSSTVFAACHAPWIGWTALGILIPGLILGFYWLRFRSLWFNVALHSAMNAVLAVISQIWWAAF